MRSLSIILGAFLFFSSLVYGTPVDLESRGYLDRKYGYDNIPYTDFGASVKFKNKSSAVILKKGVMFSSASRTDHSIGNHQWHYLSLTLQFYNVGIPSLNIIIEPYTELNTIEGNNFNLKSDQALQSFSVGYKDLYVERGKWTNGDFYTDLRYSSYIIPKYRLKGHVTCSYLGVRGASNMSTMFRESFNFLECGISYSNLVGLNKNLDFATKLGTAVRTKEHTSDVTYSISIGLIAK